ncbi:hypothetical protein [Massilia sp. DD77]|uniref:hypothetical protein n=1 Tax=Massilia sp. DD77 TaxID=3109349 RepID=UPI002FFD5FB8
MNNDQNRYPVCAKCGLKVIPPIQRAWNATWYCTCPPEPTQPDNAATGEPRKIP